MEKIKIIEKLLSNEDDVQRVMDWVSCREEMQAAARCTWSKDDLKEVLVQFSKEEFDAMIEELNVHMDTWPPPPLAKEAYQNFQGPKDDNLPGFKEQPLDCGNLPTLPESPESGSKCENCSNLEARCQHLKNQNEQLIVQSLKDLELKNKCEVLENENQELRRKRLNDLEFKNKCEDLENEIKELRRKCQISEENKNLQRKQISAMGIQIEKLKYKNAQIENTLQTLQEESKENQEENLRIIEEFHKVMVERRRKIEKLECEVQMLKEENPGPEMYELLAHAIDKKHEKEQECQELRAENKQLKEEMKRKEDVLQMQQASQAALYVTREAELARKVNEEVQKLHNVYQQINEFARRQGYQVIDTSIEEGAE